MKCLAFWIDFWVGLLLGHPRTPNAEIRAIEARIDKLMAVQA